MSKKILGIVILMIITSLLPESEALANVKLPESVQLHSGVFSESSNGKKSALKKAVRKAGRMYRKIQDDRDSKKKSRKVQRKVRSLINIF